jgi:hypothetical protein
MRLRERFEAERNECLNGRNQRLANLPFHRRGKGRHAARSRPRGRYRVWRSQSCHLGRLSQKKNKPGECKAAAKQDGPVPHIKAKKSAVRLDWDELRHEPTSESGPATPPCVEWPVTWLLYAELVNPLLTQRSARTAASFPQGNPVSPLLRRGNAQRFLNATPDCPNLIVVVPSFCQSTRHLLVALSTGRVSA